MFGAKLVHGTEYVRGTYCIFYRQQIQQPLASRIIISIIICLTRQCMMLQPDFIHVASGTASTSHDTAVVGQAAGMQLRRSNTGSSSCSSFADIFSDEQNRFLLELANDVYMEDLEDSSCFSDNGSDDEWEKSLAAPSFEDDALLGSQYNVHVLDKDTPQHFQRVSFGTVQIYETVVTGDKEYTICTKTTRVNEHHRVRRLRTKSTKQTHPAPSSLSPTSLARLHCWEMSTQQHDALFSRATSCGPIVPKYHHDVD